jgi:hypothetical protein
MISTSQRRPIRIALSALIGIVLLASGLVVGETVGTPSSASAAESKNFDPANIISDANFYNGAALSEAQVQSFLNSKVPTCGSGYTCLKSFTQSTYSRGADAMCSAYAGGSNESAARIIAKVGAACGISQKALIVTLEKEQSLVTSSRPTTSRYNIAMGYACPDTAPCNTEYYGFYNQVYKAAWQLKRYGNPSGTSNYFTWFPVGKSAPVRYHPNASCGSKSITIKNKATAALYYYTPYQPNSAALSNLYGTGDSCSAYGNRNFWRLYSDWFGSPTSTAAPTASLSSASGVYNGVRVTGTAKNPNGGTAYVWVNVDGSGRAVAANPTFDITIERPPGTYEMCAYNSSDSSKLIECRNVTVPVGAGHFDTVTQAAGGVRLTGWAVDFRTTSPDTVKVTVDGATTSHAAKVSLPWINVKYPGVGSAHGYDVYVPTSLGSHTVCVTSTGGSQGCKSITTVRSEKGSFDSATGTVKGIRVTGWALDMSTSNSSYVWITVNGVGRHAKANVALGWFDKINPGAGPNHGFDTTIPAEQGTYSVCVKTSGLGNSLGCKTVTVPSYEATSFDSLAATPTGFRLTGWSANLRTPEPSWIWLTVDGKGKAYKAAAPLTWFESKHPGLGNNHGFDISLAASPGKHTVCVSGASTGKLAGCKTVTVPQPVTASNNEQGHFDSATPVAGGIQISGWSFLRSTAPASSYVWVTVDGKGSALKAAQPLSWIDRMYGVGPNHGFSSLIPASKGTHTVCVSGASTPKSYGCKTVTVP